MCENSEWSQLDSVHMKSSIIQTSKNGHGTTFLSGTTWIQFNSVHTRMTFVLGYGSSAFDLELFAPLSFSFFPVSSTIFLPSRFSVHLHDPPAPPNNSPTSVPFDNQDNSKWLYEYMRINDINVMTYA